jgi:hypothetical protein
LHVKDVKIQILAGGNFERYNLIKRPLLENTRSTGVDVAGTHMIFLVNLLRD